MVARSLIAASVGAICVCALLADTGIAAVGLSQGSKSPVIVGGSPAQRELARLTASRVSDLTLARVVFRSPTGALRRMHVRGVEMVVSSRGKQTLRALWEQQLFVGVYLGLMGRWPRATIAAAAGFDTAGPASRLRAYDVFGSNPKAVQMGMLHMRLYAAAVRAKTRIVEERTGATPARWLALTVRVADPAAFLKHRAQALLEVLGHPNVPLLGYYLAAENAHGQVVWGVSRLPGTGGVFVVPRLDACSPVVHSEAFGHQSPPCPAR